ncbi:MULTISPECIES: biofilm-forming protein [Bacillus]|uniref:biofilm-forming protein n=1 Tax=Bacillus TaxID=1386 RepID=UPI000D01B646|nr:MULTISPECIES: biofilm-forming protein [Bacillus]MDR0125264.1 biofilm-forming protein [Bacillus zhangzhouensis]PRO41490.1 biofilm-forming protein [Bacillus sp. LLTC93]
MKRICVMMSLCFIVMFHFNIEKVAAKIIYREVEVDFIMTEQEKYLWISGGQNNPDQYPSTYGYQFSILNAEGCTLEVTLYRTSVSGTDFPSSVKEYVGNQYDLSATDRILSSGQYIYRPHGIKMTKKEGCGDVEIKGVFGYQIQAPDR